MSDVSLAALAIVSALVVVSRIEMYFMSKVVGYVYASLLKQQDIISQLAFINKALITELEITKLDLEQVKQHLEDDNKCKSF